MKRRVVSSIAFSANRVARLVTTARWAMIVPIGALSLSGLLFTNLAHAVVPTSTSSCKPLPTDVYEVNYFGYTIPVSGIDPPDQTVRVINPTGFNPLCASIYVFDDLENMKERCSCALSPDRLLVFSVFSNLTGAQGLPANRIPFGVIKILSSLPPSPPACPPPNSISPTSLHPSVSAWATHVQIIPTLPAPGGTFVIQSHLTEEEFEDEPLDTCELSSLVTKCKSIFPRDQCVCP